MPELGITVFSPTQSSKSRPPKRFAVSHTSVLLRILKQWGLEEEFRKRFVNRTGFQGKQNTNCDS